jgi:hypothetical protein
MFTDTVDKSDIRAERSNVLCIVSSSAKIFHFTKEIVKIMAVQNPELHVEICLNN